MSGREIVRSLKIQGVGAFVSGSMASAVGSGAGVSAAGCVASGVSAAGLSTGGTSIGSVVMVVGGGVVDVAGCPALVAEP